MNKYYTVFDARSREPGVPKVVGLALKNQTFDLYAKERAMKDDEDFYKALVVTIIAGLFVLCILGLIFSCFRAIY